MRKLGLILLLAAAPVVAKPTVADAAAIGGPIRAWVIHVDGRIADQVGPAHRDLVAAVPSGVRVFVGVGRAEEERELRALLDPACRMEDNLQFLCGEGELTSWARDRYLVVGKELLLANDLDDPFLWPSDRQVGELFARRVLKQRPVRSHLYFEGGDVVLSATHAFIGHHTIAENARVLRMDDESTAREFRRLLARDVVVIGTDHDPPHEHCDMYISVIGDRKLLVGDPKLTRRALPSHGGFREDTQLVRAPAFDRVAAELRHAGFKVERIPLLIGDDGNFRTWNNVVTETRADGLHVYMPRYGVGPLDRIAAEVWKRCGFKVHPISCSGSILHGGAIRCLTQVARGPLPDLERAANVGGLEPARR